MATRNDLADVFVKSWTPLTIFDNQVAPMGSKVNKGIIQALATATVPEILMDFTNQIEKGGLKKIIDSPDGGVTYGYSDPITDDEQMFVDNEIAALRGFR